ncbi:MAG: SIS domain-containing protein [Brachybacterium sp.]|uniref:SIS domain-containing protein n=1 Tax=Brachybacterium sp. TaxID=1891286 RepID=UPI003F8E53F3
MATEIGQVLSRLDPSQLDAVADAINGANRAFVLGVGREGLAARGFAMRLVHLGLETHWGWDDTTPAVEERDVFILVNGPGTIGHLDYVFEQIRATGATTVVVTGVPEADTPRAADVVLSVPASVYRGTGDLVPSIQPMGSLFEQCVQVAFDLLVLELVDRSGKDFGSLAARHRNFE